MDVAFETVGVTKYLKRKLKYSDLPNRDGWISGNQYRPMPFDLVLLKATNKFKPMPAWWTGRSWQGLRLRPKDQIIEWKRLDI